MGCSTSNLRAGVSLNIHSFFRVLILIMTSSYLFSLLQMLLMKKKLLCGYHLFDTRYVLCWGVIKNSFIQEKPLLFVFLFNYTFCLENIDLFVCYYFHNNQRLILFFENING